jgi:hypothetical protein
VPPSQVVRADAAKAIVVGGNVVRSILNTGDHARIFVGAYEPLSASYVEPWQIYAGVGVERFIGREWLVQKFDAFLDANDRGYFLLEADAGLGKTTFLAWLARRRGYVHHFVELAPAGQEGVWVGLRNLAAQLVMAWQLDPDLVEGSPPTAAARPQFLWSVLREAARARDALRPGEPIVLVIDGLDGSDRPPGLNSLGLPRQLPRGVFVLASQRPVDVMLQVDTPRRVFHLAAEDSRNLADMQAYLVRTSRVLGRQAPTDFVDILLDRCRGVWVYLAYVLAEIERGQTPSVALDELPFGLWQYYTRYWRQWRDDHPADWDRVHLPLLATLGVAETDLELPVLGRLVGVDPAEWRQLLDVEWRPFLTISAGDDPTYGLYHASLRDFLHGRSDREQLTTAEQAFVGELERATRAAHSRIADRYLHAWGGLDDGIPRLRHPAAVGLDGGYGIRHVATHLAHAGRDEDLFGLLQAEWPSEVGSRGRAHNAWHATAERIGDSGRYVWDVTLAWRLAEESSRREVEQERPAGGIGRELRCALMMVSINSIAANVPAALVRVLVEKGVWAAAQGLAYARRVPAARRRADTLVAVASSLPEPTRTRILREALEAARGVNDDTWRAVMLTAVAPHLPEDLVDEALEIARSIPDWPLRAEALTGIARHLPEPDRSAALGGLLASARRLDDEWSRAEALATLAPHLPEPLLGQAVRDGLEIQHELWRLRSLAALAPRLAEPARTAALDELQASASGLDGGSREEALATLAPYLPEGRLAEILTAAWTSDSEARTAQILAALAPHLSPTLLDKALAAASMIQDERLRAQALATLGPHLPELLLAEALAATRTIESRRWQTEALTALAGRLPASLGVTVLDEALAGTLAIQDERERAEALVVLARVLPGPLLAPALEVVRAIRSEAWRTAALAALSPLLPSILLEDALAIACTIGDATWRARALRDLEPQPCVSLARQALAATLSIADEASRAEELVALVELLPEELLADALAAARATADALARAEVLAGLAPRLPQSMPLEALAAVRLTGTGLERARLLAALARYLPEALRAGALAEALSAIKVATDVSARAEALAVLAPHLPAPLLAEALEQASRFTDGHWRAATLEALAPWLPDPLVADAFDAAEGIENGSERSRALVALAPRMPAPLLARAFTTAGRTEFGASRTALLAALAPRLPEQLLAYAVDAASKTEFGASRVGLLAALAPYLPEPLLAGALKAALAIRDDSARSEALVALAPRLDGPLLRDAMLASREIRSALGRARVVAALAPRLPAEVRTEVAADALGAVWRTVRFEPWLAETLAALAPHLPEPLLAEALTEASWIENERWRAETLAALVPHLPEAHLPEALAVAEAFEDEGWLAEALAALAPHLPEALLPEALAATQAFGEERWLAETLVALAPHLPEPLLAEALAEARTIKDERWLSRTLIGLATHLPPPLLVEGLAVGQSIRDERDRAPVLEAFAQRLAECPADLAITSWQATLPALASRRRRDLLSDLGSLRTLIMALGGEAAIHQAAAAMDDVGRWWP